MDELLNHQSGFDGLTEADTIGQQQVGARHLKRPDERIELVIFDGDTAAKGSQIGAIDIVYDAPSHGVKEGVQNLRVVKRLWLGKIIKVDGFGTGLRLPQHRERIAEGVVNGCQADEMRLRMRRRCLRLYIERDKAPTPDMGQLTDLRRRGRRGQRQYPSTNI